MPNYSGWWLDRSNSRSELCFRHQRTTHCCWDKYFGIMWPVYFHLISQLMYQKQKTQQWWVPVIIFIIEHYKSAYIFRHKHYLYGFQLLKVCCFIVITSHFISVAFSVSSISVKSSIKLSVFYPIIQFCLYLIIVYSYSPFTFCI